MLIPIVTFLARSFWMDWPSRVIHKSKFDLLGGFRVEAWPNKPCDGRVKWHDCLGINHINSGDKFVSTSFNE